MLRARGHECLGRACPRSEKLRRSGPTTPEGTLTCASGWWSRNSPWLKAFCVFAAVAVVLGFVLPPVTATGRWLLELGIPPRLSELTDRILAVGLTGIASFVVFRRAVRFFILGDCADRAPVESVVYAGIGSAILAFPGALGCSIPTHGIFLELTASECLMLLWLPLSAYWLAAPAMPLRWWVCFGLVSFLFMQQSSLGFITSQYGSGRRPWMPSDSPLIILKLVGSLSYFCLAPLVAVSAGRGATRAAKARPGRSSH